MPSKCIEKLKTHTIWYIHIIIYCYFRKPAWTVVHTSHRQSNDFISKFLYRSPEWKKNIQRVKYSIIRKFEFDPAPVYIITLKFYACFDVMVFEFAIDVCILHTFTGSYNNIHCTSNIQCALCILLPYGSTYEQ